MLSNPHLIFIPYPAQGHITPMLTLAKILHSRGFFITFINTEFNHNRLLLSRGNDCFKGLEGFHFDTIPDGLSSSDYNRTQNLQDLCNSLRNNCYPYFLSLFTKLNSSTICPPITYIICDGEMSISILAGEELGIPAYVFYTLSACGFMSYLHYEELIERGFMPLKDESCILNGYLDTQIDWIPGMEGIRLKDLPTYIRTTDINEIILSFDMMNIENSKRARGVIVNTFDDLEGDVLEGIKGKFGLKLYSLGPLSIIYSQVRQYDSKSIVGNLWKEDRTCLEWLDKREPRSVVYLNFGSIAVMTSEQFNEVAWGVAKSKQYFLWVARPDVVKEGSAFLSEGFQQEIAERGMFVNWCPQEEVLSHPSIGCFLTHCGWNSTLESISNGIPLVCWPFFGEQQTNCWFSCTRWGIGVEMDNNVGRVEVEKLVKDVMDGPKGDALSIKTSEWKLLAEKASAAGGSSHSNLESLVSKLRVM